MKNRELLNRDPVTSILINDGQARISDAANDRTLLEAKGELETFVCEGQYADGLVRILESYLSHLEKTYQPAAWISGFFGSGKSHLLKMFAHLWVNTQFPDGTMARSIVHTLPSEVTAALRELDLFARKVGGLRVAAGSLPSGSGDRVRLTVLGIIFRSVGLPEHYPQATFCLWLKKKGIYDAVKSEVEAQGKSFTNELNDLYVGKVAAALLKCDPSFSADEHGAKQLIRAQFPPVTTDIDTTTFLQKAKESLSVNGQLPCTIILLDEIQQYIGTSVDRSVIITEVAEALTRQMDSRILLIGAGQNALTAVPLLQKLKDRFTLPIELSDTDVEAVTRKVLLSKKPSAIDSIKGSLSTCAGEISRHLQGTKISERPEDRNIIVEDYPLLPVRRRFWEAAFRAVDNAGTAGQLRNQLRIIHEALREIGDKPIGYVVAADFFFEQQQTALVQQGVLLRELDERIRGLEDGTPTGKLAKRVCGLIFLVRKLPREHGVDIGIRATEDMLADLLISNLAEEGPVLRRELKGVLKKLIDQAILVKIDDEYSMQTREGSEWDREFRSHQAGLTNNEPEISAKRDAYIKAECEQIISQVKIQQGSSKEPRKVSIYFGNEAPEPPTTDIPVWVRDGWSCSETEAVAAARQAGTDSAIVYVYVPRASADDLKKYIVDSEAAHKTLEYKGSPTTDEGKEARRAMESRRKSIKEDQLAPLVREIANKAKVFIGGGTETHALTLQEKVKEAAGQALLRLFNQFREADDDRWNTVINRARGGQEDALQALDWAGPADQHPVCRAVLAKVNQGMKGREVRSAFKAAPFGWPQDAVDGALIVLHRSGHVKVTQNGIPVQPGSLDQNKIPTADFRSETVTVSTTQKVKLCGLFQSLGISSRPVDVISAAPRFLEALESCGKLAGGDAPLPQPPNLSLVKELRSKSDNEQLVAIFNAHDVLKESAEQWKKQSELAVARMNEWNNLKLLLLHGAGLPEMSELASEMTAILNSRLLLDHQDKVAPILNRAFSILQVVLRKSYLEYKKEFEAQKERLHQSDLWKQVSASDQTQILADVDFKIKHEPAVSNISELTSSLGSATLDVWCTTKDALSQKVTNALNKAAKMLEPKIQPVRLVGITLKSSTDVDQWLAAQRSVLIEKLKNGPVRVE